MSDLPFSLRRATASDAPVLWAIRADAIRCTCRSHYPDDLLERWTSGVMPHTFPDHIESGYFVIGLARTGAAGFAALNTANAQLDAVFVSPRHGRRGLGRQLLAHLEERASEMVLSELIVDASLNAVPFYRAAGYQSISKGIYVTSAGLEIACVRMQKRLAPFPR